MRVALDATAMIAGRTGIAVYVGELARSLDALGLRVDTFAVGRARYDAAPGCRHLDVPARFVHRLWRLGLPPTPERLVRGTDLVHAASLALPSTRRPLVVTVYDTVAIDHPELHPRRSRQQLTTMMRRLDRSDAVTVISGSTAQAVAATGYPEDRIVVAHPGLSARPAPPVPPIVHGPYLLAVGELHPRKGLDVLLRAMADPSVDPAVRLVHAGPPGEASPGIDALVARLGLEDRVRFLGYVDATTKAVLLRDALALCFPSRSEGFGMPVLEAMAAGTPVLASDIPPVRELVAGQAMLLQAGDVASWASGVSRFLEDPVLGRSLVGGAQDRAAGFTWDNCARATREAYALALAAR